MTEKSTPSSREGFTLIEVMIGMALLAVVSMGFMTLMESNSKGMRNVSQVFDAQNVANLVQMDLANPTACATTFTATALTFPVPPPANYSVTVNQVKTATSATIAAAAPGAPNLFNSVSLQSKGLTLQNLVANGPTTYLANFVVTASAVGASLGAQSFVRSFPVSLEVTVTGPTATITGCAPVSAVPVAQQWSGPFACVPTFCNDGNTWPSDTGCGCAVTLNWTSPFPDANYVVSCSAVGQPNCVHNCGGNYSGFHISNIDKTAGSVMVEVSSGNGNQGQDDTPAEIDCIAIHP
jgi:prepilin-type N-terminal cleavage/methylation domain-containing protein